MTVAKYLFWRVGLIAVMHIKRCNPFCDITFSFKFKRNVDVHLLNNVELVASFVFGARVSTFKIESFVCFAFRFVHCFVAPFVICPSIGTYLYHMQKRSML